MNNKQLENKLEKYKIINIISITAICVLAILLIFVCINNKEDKEINKGSEDFVYKLSGESENFTYYDAYFMLVGGKYYLFHGKVEINNEEKKKITNVTLKCDDNLIIGSSEFLERTSEENKGYGELFPPEIVKNIDKWYFEIKYIEDKKEKTEILELSNYKVEKLEEESDHI